MWRCRLLGLVLSSTLLAVGVMRGSEGDAEFRRVLHVARDCIEDKEYKMAAVALQELFNNKARVIEIKDKAAKTIKVSMHGECERLLKGLPKQGRDAYEEVAGYSAEKLLKAAGADEAKLKDLERRYFFTKAGAAGAEKLAIIQFNAGKLKESAKGFARLAEEMPIEQLSPPTLFHAARAAHVAGDTARRDRFWSRLNMIAPKGYRLGKRDLTLQESDRQITR